MKEGIFIFIKFPVRRGFTACHHHRKPFANSFLSGMSSLRAITIGNPLPIVSCPAWGHSVHLNRKPFGVADFSTPLRCARNDGGGVGLLRVITIGNPSRMVSCPAWDYYVSSP